MTVTSRQVAVPPKNVKGFSVYVKPEIHESLKNFAEKQDRSISNLASHILSEWVRERTDGSTLHLDPNNQLTKQIDDSRF